MLENVHKNNITCVGVVKKREKKNLMHYLNGTLLCFAINLNTYLIICIKNKNGEIDIL